MRTPYEHTQIGYVILGAALGGGLVGLVPAVLLVESPGPSLWFGGGILGAVAILFSSLTVRVDDETLVWYFGPHFWTKTLPLSRIERAEPVRNSPWHGWGIRMLSEGWLYNVSGLDAVEIETSDGEVVRIGTDEPTRLSSVLAEWAGGMGTEE